jgi:hypothetical protein
MAERNGGLAITPHRQGWWTGDVWRTLWALRQYRPDLDITVLDAGPTGLVLITGLDPASTLLAEREAEIVAAMMAQSLEAIGLPAWHAAQQVPSAPRRWPRASCAADTLGSTRRLVHRLVQ